jgi:thiosulfate/3-mercaptopyruvate sulfurtransferase
MELANAAARQYSARSNRQSRARSPTQQIGHLERHHDFALRRQQQLVRGLCVLEEKRPITAEATKVAATTYRAGEPDESIRARRDEVLAVVEKKKAGHLVDVRSVDEFTGKILAPPGMTETAQRAGHIPGAANVPWAQAANEDGTFKSADALASLYGAKGITGANETIAYCRIGERSSHTWFVLKYLLGYDNVRNYDGSWTEWGNLIGAPVANDTVSTALAAGAR